MVSNTSGGRIVRLTPSSESLAQAVPLAILTNSLVASKASSSAMLMLSSSIVEAICNSAARQAQMIDELLDVSRIVAGRAAFDLQGLDLRGDLGTGLRC